MNQQIQTPPATMPRKVVILDGEGICQRYGWTPGSTYEVDPTYQEEQYQKGGHYVNVISGTHKTPVPLSSNYWLPAA